MSPTLPQRAENKGRPSQPAPTTTSTAKQATSKLAHALRRHAHRSVTYHQHDLPLHLCTVHTTSPWSVEVHDTHLTVDVLTTQWVDQYDVNYGVATGDTALVVQLHDGTWVLVDLLTNVGARRWEFAGEPG